MTGYVEDMLKKGPISQIIGRITQIDTDMRTMKAIINNFPRMTTPERNTIIGPSKGFTIVNTTTNKLNWYNGTNWEEIEDSLGLHIVEGANMTMGVVTLIGGTATVNTNKITAISRILMTPQTLGTITRPTGVGVTTRVPGVSFTITSMDVTDTSDIAWLIVEPS
jgi:hypothetical protein